MNNLHDSVERWLVQDGHSVTETKTEDNFKIIIKNSGIKVGLFVFFQMTLFELFLNNF